MSEADLNIPYMRGCSFLLLTVT